MAVEHPARAPVVMQIAVFAAMRVSM